jgi:sigma-B regulation protein RsbU (phosphoserine phosphatase)
MLLGLAAAAPTADREVPFEPGDLALFYTDGVTDALDAEGRRFGAERLAATVASVGGLAAPTAVAEVLAAVDQFVGSAEPADDLTLVAVRRLP